MYIRIYVHPSHFSTAGTESEELMRNDVETIICLLADPETKEWQYVRGGKSTTAVPTSTMASACLAMAGPWAGSCRMEAN